MSDTTAKYRHSTHDVHRGPAQGYREPESTSCYCAATADHAIGKEVDAGALALAIRFHDTYERLAPSFGYETRPDTKQFDQTTPNGRLMVAVCGEIRAALAGQADAWRPIETAPRDAQCVFWIVPKSADETYHDTSGNPILSTSKPYMILGKYGDWGSLMKAAAWHPPQEIKPPTDDELAALIAPASIGAEAQEGKA